MRFVLPGPEILIKSIKKIKFQNTNTNILAKDITYIRVLKI